MSRQQIEISKLMNSYIDDEFNIEGEAAASVKAVKNRVMEQVKPKKRLKLGTKAIMIAAAVAVAGIMTAAALPYGILQSQNGTWFEFFEHEADIKTPGIELDADQEIEPYTLENGRVYFTADSQYIDITDYIERGENYYYQYTDEDNQGDKYICVVAVGGDTDDLAYGEIAYQAKPHGLAASYFSGGCEAYCYYKDGEVIIVDSEEKKAEATSYPYRNIEYPCLLAFDHQMDIWRSDIHAGKSVDVSDTVSAKDFEIQYTGWIYPEGWRGERPE